MGEWLVGNKVRISVTYDDGAAAPTYIDPTDLSLKYAFLPAGAPTVQDYNPGNIIRDSLGHFHYDLDTTGLLAAGADGDQLTYEWISTGTGQASVVGHMDIVALPI